MDTQDLKSKILSKIANHDYDSPEALGVLEWVLEELNKEESKPCTTCAGWGAPCGCPGCGITCMGN